MVAVPTPRTLPEYLLKNNLVQREALQAAKLESDETGASLGGVLRQRGLVQHAPLIAAMVEVGEHTLVGEELFSPKVPSELLISLNTMLVAEHEGRLYLSTSSPRSLVAEALKPYFPNAELRFIPHAVGQIERHLESLRRSAPMDKGVLDKALRTAIERGISDIHIIPKDTGYLMMFRHLGVRVTEHEGPHSEMWRLAARIKDLAGMDLAEQRVPQDGSFSIVHNRRTVDFRVATVPVIHGEYLVLRVLDPENVSPSMDGLGISRLEEWRNGITRSDGLCLICGPTGSGKSTTLNASIKEFDRLSRSIFTVEDPVEYSSAFTGQVSINAAVGLDFSSVLKAFMRADPDIIVLGEVRDNETAKAAARAAETGHLVLATLHNTDSIRGAALRLSDLGVPAYALAQLLRVVLVQRLMRIVCKACGGDGCADCNGVGYTGRTVVSECARFRDTDEVNRMLNGERWWPSMLDDAVSKVRDGTSSRAELLRVFGHEGIAQLDGLAGGRRSTKWTSFRERARGLFSR